MELRYVSSTPPQWTQPAAAVKRVEVYCVLRLSSVYASIYRMQNGREVLLSDARTEGRFLELDLTNVPDRATVEILGYEVEDGPVVAKYEGIAGDMKIADRVHLLPCYP